MSNNKADGNDGDRGRIPNDMKGLLKFCAEAGASGEEAKSLDRMSPEVMYSWIALIWYFPFAVTPSFSEC